VAVDILIDKLTDCLIERESDTVVETEFRERLFPITKTEFQGWKFDWSKTEEQGYLIYELFIKGDEEVQGRISLRIDGGVADVDIVETAPHNYGHTGKYIGVGGHLFAIACQCSLEAGCDGVVAFTSKSDLVEYYKRELNAIEIMPRRMVIFEDAAQLLLDKYIRK
jgi:hypothetical protein